MNFKKYIIFIVVFVIIALIGGANKEKENPISGILDFDFLKPCEAINVRKLYLAIDEKYQLPDAGYKSDDNNVVRVVGDKLIGTGVGKASVKYNCETIEVEVTDMISAPIIDENKPLVPCGQFSKEDNEFLDAILKSRVEEAGFGTRAGAVAAGRFLLLQFPYHMKYFAENGRLGKGEGTCDGEGRYYHYGLYLNEYKVEKENITKIVKGPAPWGCPIYSYPAGFNQYNSLDCSGFVTWCLYNGGHDPGDIGAGPSDDAYECSDLGEWKTIDEENLKNCKVGDLFAENGHISILIGKNNGLYYVAESNSYIDIRVRVSTAEELIASDFYAIIDMDEFYNHKDGNLTDFWLE